MPYLEVPHKATEDVETIGSRLRKRRRTGSPTLHEFPTNSKRSSLPKSVTPDRKRSSPANKRTRPVNRRTSSAEKHSIHSHARASSEYKRSSSDRKIPRNGTVKKYTTPKSEAEPQVSDDDDTESASSDFKTTLGGSPTAEVASQATQLTNQSASPSMPPHHESPRKQTPQTELSFFSNGAELQAVIQHIINHGQSIDNRRGGGEDEAVIDIDTLYSLGASVSLKTQSLPILDNLVFSGTVFTYLALLILC